MTYTATINTTIPGFDIFVRESEGTIDFHYGRSFDKSVTPTYNCGPYTATIKLNGSTIDTVVIPNHFWGADWWYDLGNHVPAVIRSPATLIAAGYVPPMGDTGLPGLTLPTAGSVTFPGPMGVSSDLVPFTNENQTGGRPTIGIVTDKGAEFLITGDARNLLTAAQSVAAQPIWDWDDTPGSATNKLIDLIAKPATTAYGNSAQGTAFWLGPWPVYVSGAQQPWIADDGHMTEICGVAALATGAPRYVRGVQARVIRGFDGDNYWSGPFGGVTAYYRQIRATAWILRELFYCYWATKLAEDAGNLPADCLASSIWKQIIDNQLTQFTSILQPQQPFQKLAVPLTHDGTIPWWQLDMLNQVLALYAGKWSEWRPIYIATFRNVAARINADGLHQWPIAYPTWYYANCFTNPPANTIPFATYPDLWAAFVSRQVNGTEPSGNLYQITQVIADALAIDPTNSGQFVAGQDREYLDWLFGAIAYAVYLDRGVLAGALSAAYPYLESGYAQYYSMMQALGSGAVIPQCSISVAPLPPNEITPPPDLPPATPPPFVTPTTILTQVKKIKLKVLGHGR